MNVLYSAKSALFLTLMVISATLLAVERSKKSALLRQASKKGFSKLVRPLTHILRVNGSDERQCTALHIAASAGNTNTVKALLKVDADINSQNSKGLSPLDLATNASHILTMEVLIQANPWQRLPQLHRYIRKGMNPVVLHLLQAGANVHEKNQDGLTPLHVAIRCNNEEITNALLNAGAKAGKMTLHLAVQHASKEIIRLLIKEKNHSINTIDQHKESPLFLAIQRKDALEVAKLLLQAGANPDKENFLYISPLYRAIEKSDYQLVKLLLRAGANPTENDFEQARIEDPRLLQIMAKHGIIIPETTIEKLFENTEQEVIEQCMHQYNEKLGEILYQWDVPDVLQAIIQRLINR